MENKDQNSELSNGVAEGGGTPVAAPVVHEPPPGSVPGISLDEPQAAPQLFNSQVQPRSKAGFLRIIRRLSVVVFVLVVAAAAVAFLALDEGEEQESASVNLADRYGTIQLPLGELTAGKNLTLSGVSNVTINGLLQLNEGLTIAPSLQPTGATAGQIYYDQGTDQLAYYNGQVWVFLTSAGQGVQSLGGATGQLLLGSGLGLTDNQLDNTGVITVQGQSGNVSFTGGDGIGIDGTTIANTGVLTVQGQNGNVALTAGPGIIINGTDFSNSGVISVVAGTPNVTVANDGAGNVTISVDEPIAGTGTVTSSGGTAGSIPLFTAGQNIEDSIITQSGLAVTVSGDLAVVTGGLSLSNALTVDNGGTGTDSLAANGVLVGNGTAAVSSITTGSIGLCLLSTAGAPTWGACPGGAGVTSLNGLTGALDIANASAAGSLITIDDASAVNKGIASFNGTNFSVSGGAVNTIQNIDVGATPTFAGVNTNNITPGGALTVGSAAQTALLQGSTVSITSNGGGDIVLTSGGGQVQLAGFDCTAFANGGLLTTDALGNLVCANDDGAGSAPAFQSVYDNSNPASFTLNSTNGGLIINDNATPIGGTLFAVQNNAGGVTYLDVTAAGIDVAGAGAFGGTLNVSGVATLQSTLEVQGASVTVGNAALAGSLVLNDGTGLTGTLDVAALGQNTIYTLPDPGLASVEICLTTGNCAGVGGGVTGTGTPNTIPLFTGTQTIGDSIITQSGTTVDIAGTLTLANALGIAQGGTGLNATPTNGQLLIGNGTGYSLAGLTNNGGLTITNGAGSIGLAVNYGAVAGTAVQGSTTLACPSGTGNLTGGGNTVTLGSGGTCTALNTVNNPTFSTSVTTPLLASGGALNITPGGALTVGATTQTALLQGSTTTITSNGVGNDIVLTSADQIRLTGFNCTTFTNGGSLTTDASGNVICANDDGAGSAPTFQSVYDNSNPASFTLNSTNGGLIINDDATPIGGTLFAIQNSDGTTSYLDVTNAGITVAGTTTVTGNINSSGGAIQTGGITRIDNSGNLTNVGSITGTTGNIDFTNFDVDGPTGNITGAGNATLQGGSLTAGADGQAGTLTLYDGGVGGSAFTGSLQLATLGQDTIYNLPDAGGATVDICLSTGNCAGAGGGITGSGTPGTIAVFTGAGAIGDSTITDDGTNVSITGDFAIQGGDLVVGTASQAGSLALHDGNGNTTTLQAGSSGGDLNFVFPVGAGAQFQCLKKGAGDQLIWDDCEGGGSGTAGVATLNGLSGTLTLQGTAGQITVADNATDTITLSLGSSVTLQGNTFNGANQLVQLNASTQLPAVSGALLTGLNASALATGTVDNARLTNGGALTVAAGTGLTGGGSVALGGTTTLNVAYGATAATAVEGDTQITITAGTNLTGGGALTLGAGGALTVNVADSPVFAGDVTVQGGDLTVGVADTQTGSLILAHEDSAFTGSLQVIGTLGQDTTYILPDAGQATVEICLTTGNCAGAGGGITGSGTTNTVAKFTGAGTIGDSSISDDGVAVTVGADLNVSGSTVTFSSLTNGFLEVDGSGVVSVGTINLGTDTVGDYMANLGALTGLSTSGNSGEGSAPTLSVLYGATAATAVQGNTTLVCAGGTGNLTGGGNTITLGSGGTCTSLNTVANPTFATSVTTPLVQGAGLTVAATGANDLILQTNGTTRLTVESAGDLVASGNLALQGGTLTLGVPNSQAGALVLANGGSAFIGTLQVASLGQDTVYTLPDPGGAAATICLTTGNCAGVGGGVTTSGGTATRLAVFSSSQNIEDSSITDDGSIVTINGDVDLAVEGSSISVGVGGPGGRTGSLALHNSTNANTVTIQSGTTGASYALTLPIGLGAANQCLKAQDGTGTLFWDDCDGGAGGGSGIETINSQTGPAITIANASGSANTITIDDAGTAQKGIAQFNDDNFTVVSGVVNTIQDISTAASPQFAGLTLTGALALGANNITGTNFSVDGATGNVTSGTINGQTINSTANFTGTVAVATSLTTPLLQSTGAMSITPGGTLTVGATGQTLTLQGSAATTLSATGGGFTTTLGFTGVPAANVTYNFDRTAAAGTYNVCTTAGNCVGLGSSITGTGTTGTIAMFTGTQAIGDSIVTQSGGTVDIAGSLTLDNALGVGSGGTGLNSTPTNGQLLIGNGTGYSLATLSNNGGLTVTNGAGTIGLAVNYGATAATAVQGNTTLVCPSGTGNITGGGTSITLGTGGTCGALDTVANPTFSTSVTTPLVQGAGLTVAATGANDIVFQTDGNTRLTIASTGDLTATGSMALQGGTLTLGADTQQGGLILYDGGTGVAAHTGTLEVIGALGQDTVYTLPDPGGATAEICLTTGNCAGAGGGITGSGTTNTVAKFTGAGTIGDSSITDDGATVTVGTALNVSGNADISGSLTAGTANAFQVSTSGAVTAVGVNSGSGLLQGSGGLTVTGATNINSTGTANTAIGNATGTFALASSGLNVTAAGAISGATTIGASGSINTSGGALQTAGTTRVDNGGNLVNIGNITGTGAVNITSGGTLSVGTTGQTLTLQGSAATTLSATGGGFATTIGFAGTPTGNVNYNFDRAATAGTYEICTTSENCVGLGGGITGTGTTGTIAMFTGAQTIGDSLLSQATGTITVDGDLNLTTGNQYQINGTQISSADLSNNADLAKLGSSQTFTGNTVAFRNVTNSTNAFNIQNQLGGQVLTVDSTNAQLILGAASSLDGRLVFHNVSNANTATIVSDTLTANRTLTLPDADGIICTDSGNCAGAGATLQTAYNFSVGGTTPKIKVNSTFGGVDIQDANTTIGANLFNVRASNGAGLGSIMLGVGNTGAVTLQNSANSTSAFNLLTQGGTTVLVGDTQNGRVLLGQGGTLAGQLVFSNATNANVVTLTSAVAGGNRTITLPDATGTICLNTGNCLGGGTGGANTALSNLVSVAINTTLLPGNAGSIDLGSGGLPFGDIYLSGTSVTPGTNNFRLTGTSTGGTRTITLPDAGGTVCLQNSGTCGFAPGTAASYIQNQNAGQQATSNFWISGTGRADTALHSPSLISTAALAITGGTTLSLQSTAANAVTLDSGTTGGVNIGTNANAKTITIGNATGATAVAVLCGTGACGFGNNATAHTTTVGSSTTTSTTNVQGGSGGISVNSNGGDINIDGDTGVFVFSNDFVDINAINDITIGANGDTSISATGAVTLQGSSITLGASNTTGTLLVVDIKTDAGDPTGVNGGMYYNSNAGKFRCFEGSSWKDCIAVSGAINLQNAYDNSTGGSTPEMVLDTTRGSLTVRQDAGAAVATLLEVQNSGGNNLFRVNTDGVFVGGGGQVLTLDGLMVAGTFRSTNQVSGNTGNVSLLSGNATSGNSGNITIDAGTASGTKGSVAIGTANTTSITLGNTGSTTTIQTTSSSTTAFRVLNASSVPLFQVDTTNSRVYVGDPAADTTGALLVLDTKTSAGDPTGVNGGMYYNSSTGKFRCYENGAWKDCVGNSRVATVAATSDSSPFTTTETEVMSVTAPLVNGQTYRVRFVGALKGSIAGDRVNGRLHQDSIAGADMQNQNTVITSTTGTTSGYPILFEAEYTATTTGNKTFVVTGQRVAGTGNINLEAGTDHPAYLYVDYIR